MSTRLVFVVMSAVHSSAAVDQLARALAPHLVLVHHDFEQTPAFRLESSNVRFVSQPRRTGWACWGFSEGIFHSLRHALYAYDFDYLQLLSPSCLPIKPVREFEAFVASSPCTAHFDCVDVSEDLDALMSVGYRAYAPGDSFRHRILRRLSWRWYYGAGKQAHVRSVAGVQLFSREASERSLSLPFRARVAEWVMHACRRPSIGRHIFDSDFRPAFGSVWFGARREVVESIVDRFEDPRIQAYFRRLWIADEFLIPTLLRYSGARRAPGNHLMGKFVGAHPSWFDESDFELLRRSEAFFARKFRDDSSDPVRYRALEELAGVRSDVRLTVVEDGYACVRHPCSSMPRGEPDASKRETPWGMP